MKLETGCYIEGSWGQYGAQRLISIARDFGCPIETADEGARDWEWEEADEAEAWLNEHVAEDGFAFGWHDSEWFYQSSEWWEEEGN